jgi:hypothetical protein
MSKIDLLQLLNRALVANSNAPAPAENTNEIAEGDAEVARDAPRETPSTRGPRDRPGSPRRPNTMAGTHRALRPRRRT